MRRQRDWMGNEGVEGWGRGIGGLNGWGDGGMEGWGMEGWGMEE